MPRGALTVSALKCPHFDFSKAGNMDSYINFYKQNKLRRLLEGLQPSAKTALSAKLEGFQLVIPELYKLLINI